MMCDNVKMSFYRRGRTKMSRETYEILNNIFNGQTPLKRANPKAGESGYYYIVPGQENWTSLSKVKTVDVPSASTPNPYLQPQNTVFGQSMQLAQNNVQMTSKNPKDFWNNVMDSSQNDFNKIKQDYFGERNFQNRYRKGCSPSNIAYNTISNYQISPNPKLVEDGNIVSNYAMNKFLSKIPIVGTYVNGIVNGQKLGNGVTNFYNALDEAGCFK